MLKIKRVDLLVTNLVYNSKDNTVDKVGNSKLIRIKVGVKITKFKNKNKNKNVLKPFLANLYSASNHVFLFPKLGQLLLS